MKNEIFLNKFDQQIVFPIKINTRLRRRKDHFVITIYKEDREKLNLSENSIIIINLNSKELIRPVRKDYHISLPNKLLSNKDHGDEILLNILKITKRDKCLFRPTLKIKRKKFDLRALIPQITDHGYPLYVISRGNKTSSIWFPIGGGVNHMTLNNFVNFEKLSELLGFYFGDGTKCQGIQSFRMTNCEPSVLIYCVGILQDIGITKEKLKVQVIYSTPDKVTKEIEMRCITFWSEILGLKKKQIVSVSKSNNIRESKLYGSARIFIDSSVMVQVFVRGIMQEIIKKIVNPKTKLDYVLLKGFMRGLLAAEGYPEFNIHKSLVKVGIAFNPHSDELELYHKLLVNLGITYGKTNRNALYTYHRKNMKKFKDFDAFKLHKTRNKKFLDGYKNNSML